jgi:hypothetical protein
MNCPPFLLLWYEFHFVYFGTRTLLWRGLLSRFGTEWICSRSHYYWLRSTSFFVSLLFRWPVLCAIKLRVHDSSSERCAEVANTISGASLTAADVGTGLTDFLVVCDILLEIWLFISFSYRVHIKSAKNGFPSRTLQKFALLSAPFTIEVHSELSPL